MPEKDEAPRRASEDQVHGLRYAIDAMERQSLGYPEGSLERRYAGQIVDSCRRELEKIQGEVSSC